MAVRRATPKKPRRRTTRKLTQRRRSILNVTAVVAALAVVSLVLIWVLQPTQPRRTPTPPVALVCPRVPDIVVLHIRVPAGPVGGYCQPQLAIAAQIVRAADVMSLPTQAKNIGVMTAIGESGLRNINFGDKAGPDSRGIFQQRASWGPLDRRMSPFLASQSFFLRLVTIPNWQTIAPTAAAHAVQRNADPTYYAKFWPRALLIVAELDADRTRTPLQKPK